MEIWERTSAVIGDGAEQAKACAPADLAALGITNQRETTVVWNRRTGRPYYNAIVWQDTRTDKIAAALDKDGRGDVIRHPSRPAARHVLLRRQDRSGSSRTSTACARGGRAG